MISLLAEAPNPVDYITAIVAAFTLLLAGYNAFRNYHLQKATLELQKSDGQIKAATLELQRSSDEIKAGIAKSDKLIRENELTIAISKHARELKQAAYFAMVESVELMLMKCAKFEPGDTGQEIIDGDFAVKLIHVHLVGTPALSKECLNFGVWMLQTVPAFIKSPDAQLKKQQIIVECRKKMLPVFREMRKELGIDGRDQWEVFEGVWQDFLAQLPELSAQVQRDLVKLMRAES